MSSNRPPAAVNPLPPIIWALVTPVVLLEIGFWLGGRGFMEGESWRFVALQDQAVFAQLFQAMWFTGIWPASELDRLVTYPFIHLSGVHMIMGCVFLLALGKMVAEVFNAFAVVAIFFGSAIFGALAFSALTVGAAPLTGLFPAVYGLIGAYTYILYVRLGAIGAPQQSAFSLIAMLMGIQLLFSLLFGGNQDWVADLGGFAAGFVLSVVVSPGGFRRLRARMQRR